MAGNYLPGVLGLIAEEIGEETAVVLAENFGGRVIYVPQSPKCESRLVKALGVERVKKLFDLLGAGDLLVPCGSLSGARARRRRVVELHLAGFSNSQIAEELNVHIRTVERALQDQTCVNQLCLRL